MPYLQRTGTAINEIQYSTDLETRISQLESRLTSLEGSVLKVTKVTTGNFDNLTTTGIYFINSSSLTNRSAGNTNWGTLLVFNNGTCYQMFIPDNQSSPIYVRSGSGTSMTANKAWTQIGGSNYATLVGYIEMLKIIANNA